MSYIFRFNDPRWRQRNGIPSVIAVEYWARHMHAAAKDRAAKQGLEFNLEPSDITCMIEIGRGRCTASDIPLNFNRPNGRPGPKTPSLDRKDASKGYTRLNVRIICYALNVAFLTWGDDAFAEIAEQFLKYRTDEPKRRKKLDRQLATWAAESQRLAAIEADLDPHWRTPKDWPDTWDELTDEQKEEFSRQNEQSLTP